MVMLMRLSCLPLPVILAFMMMVFRLGVQGNTECKEKVADVVFLLDSSFSIWQHQFDAQLSFLKDLVDSFTIGPNNIRVGVATYSTSVRLDVALNEHTNKHDLRHAIGQIQYMEGGTRTSDAIRFAHTEMFTPEKGGRPWAAHVAILITDGYSYNPNQTSLEASVARSKGIELFAIGVGEGVDETELRAIASSPDSSHVFQVENYGALKHIHKVLASKACHKANTTDSAEDSTLEPDNPKDTATKRCGGKPADVYFLLDSSSSIWRPEFQDQLHFLTQLLHLFDLGPDSTRVGVAVFSDRVHNIVSLTDHQSSHSIKKALQRAPYLTGNTNTGLALQFVRTQAFASARREVAHVIIILTDGQSTNVTFTLEEARAARKEGIYVFAVGIGSQTDVDELMEIASDPDENFMFHVDNFGGLKNIRELLAIKTCDVKVPDYQGDQADSDCRVSKPTDVLFVYDLASVSRLESDVISDVIRSLVEHMDSAPDTVRFGLIRGNCHKGDNVDLQTGAKSHVLMALLQKPHHQGLHALLKRVRLHGYLAPYDVERSRARKVMVLFVGTKMADPAAVENEIKRLRFQGVQLLVVAVDTARDNVDMLRRVANVGPVVVETHQQLRDCRDEVLERFCELNRLQLH